MRAKPERAVFSPKVFVPRKACTSKPRTTLPRVVLSAKRIIPPTTVLVAVELISIYERSPYCTASRVLLVRPIYLLIPPVTLPVSPVLSIAKIDSGVVVPSDTRPLPVFTNSAGTLLVPTRKLPQTSSLLAGEEVPIPTSPVLDTKTPSSSPSPESQLLPMAMLAALPLMVRVEEKSPATKSAVPVKVGASLKTTLPVPVSLDRAVAKLALVISSVEIVTTSSPASSASSSVSVLSSLSMRNVEVAKSTQLVPLYARMLPETAPVVSTSVRASSVLAPALMFRDEVETQLKPEPSDCRTMPLLPALLALS